MAVVFISPKQRQKVFFIGITVMLLLFLVIISLGVFLVKPQEVSPVLVFNKPKVNIDMSVLDSSQFKNLQPLVAMDKQFNYTATAKDKTIISGFISASSLDQAKKTLENSGLVVTSIKLVSPGRDNPFMPYYQRVITPNK